MTYRVIERNRWSYVEGDADDPTPAHSGPWRYGWEAQDYADELNRKHGDSGVSPAEAAILTLGALAR